MEIYFHPDTMMQTTTNEPDVMPMKAPASLNERQNMILNFMEEYESAEEDEKGSLLAEFENNHANFFQLM